MSFNGRQFNHSTIFVILYIILGMSTISIFVYRHPINDYDIIFNSSEIGMKTDFYPYAYRLIMDKDKWVSYVRTNSDTKMLSIINEDSLDFKKRMYLIVYGAKIKNMYWSFKSTLFDDVNASYSKGFRKGKKLIMVDYMTPDGNIYVYRMNTNPALDL